MSYTTRIAHRGCDVL